MGTRVAWLTDIHLDFLEPPEVERLCEQVRNSNPQAVLISGDISVADQLESHLAALDAAMACPIYFVLGNHDYYRSSIAAVRASLGSFCAGSTRLRWLTLGGVFPLSAHTALIGHDSWSDGRLGNHASSPVLLNDFFLIEELVGLEHGPRLLKLNALGDEAAAFFERLLPQALDRYENVILLTHVPPFEAACWHEGRISGADYLPYFSCKAVGDVLTQCMQDRPERRLTVLCGHTHGEGVAQILPNLVVMTGGAEYGRPTLQPLIDLI